MQFWLGGLHSFFSVDMYPHCVQVHLLISDHWGGVFLAASSHGKCHTPFTSANLTSTSNTTWWAWRGTAAWVDVTLDESTTHGLSYQ